MSNIINNSSINYAIYYNVINYFKEIMTNHPSIGHVTQGSIEDFDKREFPMYPVGNVSILQADIAETTTSYTIQLVIADKVKNKNNDVEGENLERITPFYGVDDVVDIHANTFGIINDLTSFTEKSLEAFDIEDQIICTPFQDRFNNGLAGWVCEFNLLTHNSRDRCLFNLLPQS